MEQQLSVFDQATGLTEATAPAFSSGVSDLVSSFPFPILSVANNAFTLDKTPNAYLEAVLIRTAPEINRAFFNIPFKMRKPGDKPICTSLNGVAPHPSSPQPQSTLCSTCPQEEAGSAADGLSKACPKKFSTFWLRVNRNPDNTLVATDDVFFWNMNASSFIGTSFPEKNLWSIKGGEAKVQPKGLSISHFVLQFHFDIVSQIPNKVVFMPIQHLQNEDAITPKVIEVIEQHQQNITDVISGKFNVGQLDDGDNTGATPAQPPPQAATAPAGVPAAGIAGADAGVSGAVVGNGSEVPVPPAAGASAGAAPVATTPPAPPPAAPAAAAPPPPAATPATASVPAAPPAPPAPVAEAPPPEALPPAAPVAEAVTVTAADVGTVESVIEPPAPDGVLSDDPAAAVAKADKAFDFSNLG